jgi:pilus assembly protein TadC
MPFAWAGFLAPDFWLGNQIKKRQSKIRRGLPDVLDLLVICIEAGLSLDQATARTASEELNQAQPELCDELNVVVLEQRAGRPRQDSLEAYGGAHRRGLRPQPGFHAGSGGAVRNQHRQDIAHPF